MSAKPRRTTDAELEQAWKSHRPFTEEDWERVMWAQLQVPEDYLVLWAERVFQLGAVLIRGQMVHAADQELFWFNICVDASRINRAAVARFMAKTKPGALPMEAERSPQGRHRRVGPWLMRRGGARRGRKEKSRHGA